MEFKFASNVESETPYRPPQQRLEELVGSMHDRITVTSNNAWIPSPQDLPRPNSNISDDDDDDNDEEDDPLQEEEEEHQKWVKAKTIKKAKVEPPPPLRGGGGGGGAGNESKSSHPHPPPPPPRSLLYTIFWWIMAMVLGAGLMAGVHFYSVSIGTKLANGNFVAATAFPIWSDRHKTTSVPLNMKEPFAKPLLASLEHSLHFHLSTSSAYACLCMHHLKIHPSSPGQFQVCAVHNRYMNRVHLMVNPRLVGHGNLTDFYDEQSVSLEIAEASRTSAVPRFRTIFVEWTDVETGDVLLLQLNGMQAVCMQVALDEISPHALKK